MNRSGGKGGPGEPNRLLAAEKICAAGGERLTSLRRRVLEALLAADGPVKAYDLAEAARGDAGRNLAPTTIYRVLDFLSARGLAHRVNALNAYVACRDLSGHHQPLLLVCPNCRQTEEINDSALRESLFARLGQLGFPRPGGSVEVRGVCPECRSGRPEAAL